MEPLQKIDKTDEKKIHWASRISQAKNWNMLLRQISLAKADENNPRYYRLVDALIDSLFKKERDEIEKFVDSIDPSMDKFECYCKVERKIIDVLDREDYLKYYYTPTAMDEFEEGHAEFIKEGDESGPE